MKRSPPDAQVLSLVLLPLSALFGKGVFQVVKEIAGEIAL
jgi:hypothetical protein